MPDKHILVVETDQWCQQLQRHLTDDKTWPRSRAQGNPDFFVVPVGRSIMGHRTMYIIIAEALHRRLTQPDETAKQQNDAMWWRDNMLCRLTVGGKVVVI